MPFRFFKMTAANKPTGAYSRPRTGSSYTSRKVYKTDERGRRVVAGTTVGRYDKRRDRIVYDYRPVVERKKPTMSNFLASLFKPVIDKKVDDALTDYATETGTTYNVKKRTLVLPDNFLDFDGKEDPIKAERRLAFEKEKAATKENIRKEKIRRDKETIRRAGLIGSEPDIGTRINQITLQKLPSSGTNLQSGPPSVFSGFGGLLDYLGSLEK